MDLREPEPTDAERVHDLVRSAMTASYALTPGELDVIAEEQFGVERLQDTFSDDDIITVLAVGSVDDDDASEDGGGEETILGVVEATTGENGESNHENEIRWLFVDPEHRGRGAGGRLFETAADTLRDRGAETVRASTLEDNTEGGQFFAEIGFEHVEQRDAEMGDQSFVEQVYAESADGDGDASDPTTETEHGDQTEVDVIETDDLPDVAVRDGSPVATTDDGREVFLNREEEAAGSEGPLIPAHEDAAHDDQYGYYCGNCGSLDVTVDETEQIDCPNCANTRSPRSEETADDAYL